MAEGNEDALGLLYDRWSAYLYSVAVKILEDSKDAEEVLEDTFWQAWRSADRFRPHDGMVAQWLTTIVRSRALDRRRARGRRILTPLEDDTPPVNEIASPLDATISSEKRSRVRTAIEGLPAEQREAVRLAYFEGLSQREIAQRLGQPLGTIKTRMRLAALKLKSQLSALHDALA